MTNPGLPLHGVRVVALEQAVAAPFCSRQLADLGADVIKVERPDGGDMARGYDSVLHGESAYFVWLNRGKRSIVLDLKKPEDRDICERLIARADVFVHNLGAGSVERLGFGYDELHTKMPRLIWCGISGYGPDGPQRDRKAYDLLVQAESGVIAITGTPDEPAKVGISVADIGAGMYAYSSILAALIQRGQTNRGTRIDISMLECLVEWMTPALYVWLGSGHAPARMGVRHNMVVPYGAYRCADGQVILSVQNQREWQRFCTVVLERPELAVDERFCSNELRLANRAALEALIEHHFREHDREDLTARLDQAGIANATLNDVAAVADHAQLKARDRWVTVGTPSGSVPALLPPHNLGDVDCCMGRVPRLGEHTAEILIDL